MAVPLFGQPHVDRYRETDGEDTDGEETACGESSCSSGRCPQAAR